MPLGAAALLSDESNDGQTARAPGAVTRDLMVVGRLKPHVTLDAANAALRALSGGLGQARSTEDARYLLTVSLLSRFQQRNRPVEDTELVVPLGALVGAALILLVIASLNVANMQLARGRSRRTEIAMRLALGAGRGRIIGQLMIEGLLLALAGGAVGLVVSVWALQRVVTSFTSIVPQAVSADAMPDGRVWLASLAFCALSGVAFSLGPAWKLSRLDLLPELKCHDGNVGRAAGCVASGQGTSLSLARLRCHSHCWQPPVSSFAVQWRRAGSIPATASIASSWCASMRPREALTRHRGERLTVGSWTGSDRCRASNRRRWPRRSPSATTRSPAGCSDRRRRVGPNRAPRAAPSPSRTTSAPRISTRSGCRCCAAVSSRQPRNWIRRRLVWSLSTSPWPPRSLPAKIRSGSSFSSRPAYPSRSPRRSRSWGWCQACATV